MKSFVKHYLIDGDIEDVWDALTNPTLIDEWGAGPNVVMSAKAGEKFSLWDGATWGKNLEVVPEKMLKQEWYGGDWDEPSIVIFKLEAGEDGVEVHLEHENLPDDEADSFNDGWDNEYMLPLKKLIEAG